VKMKIIFVCKHNRFRSKTAEAYFKKINKNKNISVSSGGIIKGIPVAKTVVKAGKELGIKISRKTRCLREKDLVAADLIIITANDVPRELFKPRFKKVRLWKFPDTNQDNKKSIKKIMKGIMEKTRELNKTLKLKSRKKKGKKK
jgi:protein-tyrosine-phosphatase